MSYIIAGTLVVVSVGTTALAMQQQQDIADNMIKQGEMDLIASNSATQNAEEEERRRESEDLTIAGRELLRAQSTASAIQAETGVAGVAKERQKRNIDMQNTFDVEQIKSQGDQMVFGIRNSGFTNNQSIQNSINQAKASRPSDTNIAVQSLLSGVSTGLTVGLKK